MGYVFQKHHIFWYILLLTLVLGVFYVLEMNFVLQDSSRLDNLKGSLRELTLDHQSLLAEMSSQMNERGLSAVKHSFDLTEVTSLTFIEPGAVQFSLREYLYE